MSYDNKLTIKNSCQTPLNYIITNSNEVNANINTELCNSVAAKQIDKPAILAYNNQITWIEYVKKSENQKLVIYIIKGKCDLNHNWHQIIKNKLYFIKKEYSLEELNSNNWVIDLCQ